jgi:hypothetical protein
MTTDLCNDLLAQDPSAFEAQSKVDADISSHIASSLRIERRLISVKTASAQQPWTQGDQSKSLHADLFRE